ncbi:MAG TPA: sensor histidine kinase [Actinomycetes bacterium]
MRRLGWQVYLGLGIGLCTAYYLVPATASKLVVWPLIGGSAATATVLGTRWHRPASRLAWYLFAAGQLSFVIGGWLQVVRVRVIESGPVFPSVADLFSLAFYPILVAGLLLLIRCGNPGRDLASLADASIIVIGLGLLSWVFLISPYIWRAGLTPGERLVSIAYPLGDVLVLAVAARLAIGVSNRPATWWLLTGGIVPLLFGDTVAVFLQVSNTWTWQHQQLLDLCWILFYVGFGTAALHPSMVSLSEPTPVRVRLSRGRLLLLAGACLLPSAILAIQAGRGRESLPTVIALAVGSAALFLLALLRMRGLAGELATHQERELTGQRVLRVAEFERTRLAAELHDGPVQRLTALLYNLEVARLHLKTGELHDADRLLSVLETDLSVDIESLRRLMSQLRPPVLDELGMASALTSHGGAFQDASGVACTVNADTTTQLTGEQETVLYRVTQEALSNVAKHARASRVWVLLASDNGLTRLQIRDDGIGFDPATTSTAELVEHGHFGLAGMRERVEMVGGRLLIDSGCGRGTTIAVELAVDPALQAASRQG